MLLRKCGSVGNRTRNLCDCSHRGESCSYVIKSHVLVKTNTHSCSHATYKSVHRRHASLMKCTIHAVRKSLHCIVGKVRASNHLSVFKAGVTYRESNKQCNLRQEQRGASLLIRGTVIITIKYLVAISISYEAQFSRTDDLSGHTKQL
jgi:hypothetical protein